MRGPECGICGSSQRSGFPSEEDFRVLDRRLRVDGAFLKVGEVNEIPAEPRFWLFGWIGFGQRTEAVRAYDLWQCAECSQVWKLSEPDMAWRGFFLRAD